MLRDLELDLDLGWGQCRINIHSTCRTSSLPNRVTVSSKFQVSSKSVKRFQRRGSKSAILHCFNLCLIQQLVNTSREKVL